LLATVTNESIDQFRDETVGADIGITAGMYDGYGGGRALRCVGGHSRQLTRTTNQAGPGDVAASSPWALYNAPIGFCDGSSQATCNRHVSNRCLLANRQFYKGGLLASAASEWLSLAVPSVSEGVILLRFDWAMEARLTEATPGDVPSSSGNRLAQLPDDFRFEYSVGSSAVVSLDRGQFLGWGSAIADDLVYTPSS
jgi:hypothetical protein